MASGGASPAPAARPPQSSGPPTSVVGDGSAGIPLPRWALLAIVAGAAFLLASCLVCIACRRCRRRRRQRRKKGAREEVLDLGGAPHPTSAHLVQPDADGAALGLEDPKRGRVQVSLEYHFRSQELRVGLQRAADLKAPRAGGLADPYARVSLSSDPRRVHETAVHQQTLSPEFQESCIFQVPQAELPAAVLVIRILAFRRFSPHCPLGELRLPLATADLGHVLEQWYELGAPGRAQQEPRGELCLSLRYVPSTGKLTVVVLEARGLRQGLSAAYVKIQLLLNRKKWKKKKTSVKESTSSPYFNEAFAFAVPLAHIQNVDLLVSVWGRGRTARGEALGKLLLGGRAAGHQLHHWSAMLAQARRPIAQWHRLQPPEEVAQVLQLKKRPRLPLAGP